MFEICESRVMFSKLSPRFYNLFYGKLYKCGYLRGGNSKAFPITRGGTESFGNVNDQSLVIINDYSLMISD